MKKIAFLTLVATTIAFVIVSLRSVLPSNAFLIIIYLAGITNILSFFLIFLSCRCLIGVEFVKKMMKYPWYNKFYHLHCWYWYILFVSVVIHTVTAFLVFGNPLF
ncbi:MAG TPA: hypothetical protein VJ179_03420 [Patescibacteria group bacterium]|nr:hypothetical protein [Patescibacteria group bacterium]